MNFHVAPFFLDFGIFETNTYIYNYQSKFIILMKMHFWLCMYRPPRMDFYVVLLHDDKVHTSCPCPWHRAVSQHKLCASHTRFQWTVWYFPTNIVIHAAQSHAQQLAILWSQLKQVIHSNSNIKIHKSSCNLKWISETRSHHSLQQTP